MNSTPGGGERIATSTSTDMSAKMDNENDRQDRSPSRASLIPSAGSMKNHSPPAGGIRVRVRRRHNHGCADCDTIPCLCEGDDELEREWARPDATPQGKGSRGVRSARRSLHPVFSAHTDLKDGSKAVRVHDLVGGLDSEFGTRVAEVTGRLGSLAYRATREERHDLAVSGAPEKLLELLESRAPRVEVVAALQNFAASDEVNDNIKERLVQAGAVEAMAKILNPKANNSRVTIVHAVAVILNMAIGSDVRKNYIIEAGAVKPLVYWIMTPESDFDIAKSVLMALTSLSIGSERRKAIIDNCNVLPRVMELIDPDTSPVPVIIAALSLIQSLVFCNDERKLKIFTLGFTEKVTLLLASKKLSPSDEELAAKLLKGLAEFKASLTKLDAKVIEKDGTRSSAGSTAVAAADGILDWLSWLAS
eukprot:m.9465 g.9465  ORF g.9465 m.9465 type:complete len:420 (+) comp4068_c0_seq2:218-1477(+)